MAETSTKPYLVRALYEWCCDNGYTPYLAVSVDGDTIVPRQYVRNGEIVLNVSPAATHQLLIGNDRIEFQARFSGVAQTLSIPVGNVTAIYARETGHGMAFEVTRAPAQPPIDTSDELAQRRQGGPGQSEGRRRDAEERAGGERSRPARGDEAQAAPGEAGGGAEVIAFGPDAARRRRRGGNERANDRDDRGEREGRTDHPEPVEGAGRSEPDAEASRAPRRSPSGRGRDDNIRSLPLFADSADSADSGKGVDARHESPQDAAEGGGDREAPAGSRRDRGPVATPIRPEAEPTSLDAVRAERTVTPTEAPDGDAPPSRPIGRGDESGGRREGGGRRRRGERPPRAPVEAVSPDPASSEANAAGESTAGQSRAEAPSTAAAPAPMVPAPAVPAPEVSAPVESASVDLASSDPASFDRDDPARETADALDGGASEPPDDDGGGGGRRPRLTRVK